MLRPELPQLRVEWILHRREGGYASRNCWSFESFAGVPFTAGESCHMRTASRRWQIGYRWQPGT
jgi:hypothetical protein